MATPSLQRWAGSGADLVKDFEARNETIGSEVWAHLSPALSRGVFGQAVLAVRSRRRGAVALGLLAGEVAEDRVDDFMIENERDDAHLGPAVRAHQRVHLVDPLDQLAPAPTQQTGIRGGLLTNLLG